MNNSAERMTPNDNLNYTPEVHTNKPRNFQSDQTTKPTTGPRSDTTRSNTFYSNMEQGFITSKPNPYLSKNKSMNDQIDNTQQQVFEPKPILPINQAEIEQEKEKN